MDFILSSPSLHPSRQKSWEERPKGPELMDGIYQSGHEWHSPVAIDFSVIYDGFVKLDGF
jgi:hypothetical protein